MAKEFNIVTFPVLEEKAECFKKFDGFSRRRCQRLKKRWYYQNYAYWKLKRRVKHRIAMLSGLRLPKYLSFLRWVYIDFLRCKNRRFWGIYQFVALPGEGKTLSMVAHMERARRNNPDIDFVIGTNFNYVNQDFPINHWADMIDIALYARKKRKCCILAVDEIHITFDSSDYRSFPGEILALLSFNRKFNLQFLCSSQIYDRIPKKIRDIANYTVICKNVLSMDRLFRNYYFTKDNYDTAFSGQRAKAEFIREYVADDKLYKLYNTLEQVDKMTSDAKGERTAKEKAFELLFGKDEPETENASEGTE